MGIHTQVLLVPKTLFAYSFSQDALDIVICQCGVKSDCSVSIVTFITLEVLIMILVIKQRKADKKVTDIVNGSMANDTTPATINSCIFLCYIRLT